MGSIRVYRSRPDPTRLTGMLRGGRDGLIQFLCVAPDHAVRDGLDQLTVHEGKWAFCPRGRIAPVHQWEPTGGVDLRELATFASGRTAVPLNEASTGAESDEPRGGIPARS